MLTSLCQSLVLLPCQSLVCPLLISNGHCVNEQHADEVNAAMLEIMENSMVVCCLQLKVNSRLNFVFTSIRFTNNYLQQTRPKLIKISIAESIDLRLSTLGFDCILQDIWDAFALSLAVNTSEWFGPLNMP